MVFGFQVVCLLVTLVTVFAYIAHHVYSREHRLLPLFLGVIAVFDFYRIVLMLTGAVGLFAQLENLLILTLTTVISYYAVDYLHIKLPHAIHVGLFLYLIVLLILIFLHFDQPDTYVVAFRFFTISNALFVSAGALYSYETQTRQHYECPYVYRHLSAVCGGQYLAGQINTGTFPALGGMSGKLSYHLISDLCQSSGGD